MTYGMVSRALWRVARAVGRLLRRMLSPFAWRDARCMSEWVYQENALTGDRRAVHLGRGYAGCDIGWLREAAGRGTILGTYSSFPVKDGGSA